MRYCKDAPGGELTVAGVFTMYRESGIADALRVAVIGTLVLALTGGLLNGGSILGL